MWVGCRARGVFVHQQADSHLCHESRASQTTSAGPKRLRRGVGGGREPGKKREHKVRGIHDGMKQNSVSGCMRSSSLRLTLRHVSWRVQSEMTSCGRASRPARGFCSSAGNLALARLLHWHAEYQTHRRTPLFLSR